MVMGIFLWDEYGAYTILCGLLKAKITKLSQTAKQKWMHTFFAYIPISNNYIVEDTYNQAIFFI